jgi:hypothetical protein
VNRALNLRNSDLLDDYGLGEEQLVELLNQWRNRALASPDVGKGDRAANVKPE